MERTAGQSSVMLYAEFCVGLETEMDEELSARRQVSNHLDFAFL